MRKSPEWTQFAKYPVTAGTVVLAAAATIASWLKVDVSVLFADAHVGRWQIWRLVTDVLPHRDLLHFAFNVIWLWRFGTIVEEGFGPARTLGIFLFFAICSSAAEYAILDGGIGLSGVVYGLFGLLWILQIRDARFADGMNNRVVQLFIGWFFFCILLTVTNILPIGNIAHGVGAVAGVALGFCLTLPRHRAAMTTSVILALTAICISLAIPLRPLVNISKYAGSQEAQLGYEAIERGDNADAARWLNESTRLNPRVAGDWYNLGIAYQRLKRYPESLAAYHRAAELEPENEQYKRMVSQMDAWMKAKGIAR